MKNIFITLLLLVNLSYAKDKKTDEIDYVSLATLLLKDGNIVKASDALKNADTSKKEFDFVMYYTLNGLVFTKLNNYEDANKNFQLALDNGQNDKSLYLYMAQNSFKLKKYEDTIIYIKNSKELANNESIFALKAESEFRLAKVNDALETLSKALKLYPKHYQFNKQRFAYLVSFNLYQSAINDASIYLKNAPDDAKSALAFISALKKSGSLDSAIILGEKSNLIYSSNAKITVLLAQLYIDKGYIQAAAELYDEASYKDYKFTKESAELYRRSRSFVQALYKNSQILDTKEKFKQRVAIYLEYSNFENIVAMRDAIYRSGLIEDENMRYALAYSYYMIGEYEESESELKNITDSSLFTKAIELRKNMEKCKDNHWECE